jgi:hypothetical protein
MTFWLARRGVASRIETFLSDHERCEIYWVTYCVNPPPTEAFFATLGRIKKRGGHLKVICRHPLAARTEQIIEKKTLASLEKAGAEIRGIMHTLEALPDEADIDGAGDDDYGPIHAKFIAARDLLGDGEAAGVLFGSFNLSGSSLGRACESGGTLADPRARREALQHARELWEVARAVTEEDCSGVDNVPDGPPLPIVRVPGVRAVKRAPLSVPTALPPFDALLEVLDEKLQNYPLPGQQFQWDVYMDIAKRKRRCELLYMPVGCGKTYIALRWLLQAASDVSDASRGGTLSAVYLTPNLWIEKTVKKAFESVIDEAVARNQKIDRRTIQRCVLIGRPSDRRAAEDTVQVIVADEVHNWAPGRHRGTATKSEGERTYTGVLDALRARKAQILGLSATPCRVEHHKFDRRKFIEHWLGQDCNNDDAKPVRSFEEAVSDGMVCPLQWREIAKDKQAAIEGVLQTATTQLGDYAKVALGDAWGVLVPNRDAERSLAKEILDEVKRAGARRVVVFLPPLAERVDGFVAQFSALFAQLGKAYDFRSVSDENPRDAFTDFASTKARAALLTIDRFSEGVSVTDIDLLVMLRPTLSPRVAVQQVGRGVRLHPGKKACVVLDAVRFQERWKQWESSGESDEGGDEEEVNEVDAAKFGSMTLAEARDGKHEGEIAGITGLSKREVATVLADGGKKLVRNAFEDNWPQEEEEDGEERDEDAEKLGGMTLAEARDGKHEGGIARIAGLSKREVANVLADGGKKFVRNAFEGDWPQERVGSGKRSGDEEARKPLR